MTAKQINMRDVPKNDYGIYLDRAKSFFSSMKADINAGRWPSVGVMAVHCAISLSDAVLVFNTGQRPCGDDHSAAAEALSRLNIEGAAQQSKTLGRILAKKHAVEYDERAFRQNEALEIAKQAERFFLWGSSKLPGGRVGL